MQTTNALAQESSPYLLQHAYNPVHWMPWGDEAFKKARTENKLLIISIGYSSCHWCHVMEHETFEDSAAAALMNAHFIPVKVDREERPDVDQVYMTAVQLMTRQGGWPLNVIALPDGRPIWGGTYFPRENWMKALQSIYEIYRDDPAKVLEYAEKLHEGIVQSELVAPNSNPPAFSQEETQAIFFNWQQSLDTVKGGPDRTPKFPLPNNYQFLLEMGHLSKNDEALQQVRLTLKRMAYGGIYDQVGGGFARYSTDADWKVPHFEKMLYDNAQLVSLYSQAYTKFKDPMYARIINETLDWVEREMTGENGEFFSALDADSEGEEGKFYIWTKAELQQLVPEGEWQEFAHHFNINETGLWENDHYILLRNPKAGAAEPETEKPLYAKWKDLLFEARSKRERPGLDDKALTSWNGLMIIAYLDAYKALVNDQPEKAKEYRQRAIRNAEWLLKNQAREDGSLYHSYRSSRPSIEGLLEDYAFATAAFLKLFEISFDETYLQKATEWTEYARRNFRDSATGLFYTRNLQSDPLIAQSMETTDNVIPASNSVMALNLFYLNHYLGNAENRSQAKKMLNQVKDQLLRYGESYSNWGRLMLYLTYPYYEVAISGKDARTEYEKLQHAYLPNVVWIGAKGKSELVLLQNRFMEGETHIYVCQNKVCQLPVQEADKALDLIR